MNSFSHFLSALRHGEERGPIPCGDGTARFAHLSALLIDACRLYGGDRPVLNFTDFASVIYLFAAALSRKRIRMVAASARVAVPLGTMVEAVRPVMRPSALAQAIASSAHSEIAS